MAVVAVVVEEAGKDVFVSPVTTDADCTPATHRTKQIRDGDQEKREGKWTKHKLTVVFFSDAFNGAIVLI